MTTYHKNGIQFMYPENWNLIENHSDGTLQVSLQSPGSCVWDLFVFEDRDAIDSTEQFVATLQEQYDEFESDPIQKKIGERELQGFEANFYCLDLLVTAQVIELPPVENERRIVMFQGESREFEENQMVFDAITLSSMSAN